MGHVVASHYGAPRFFGPGTASSAQRTDYHADYRTELTDWAKSVLVDPSFLWDWGGCVAWAVLEMLSCSVSKLKRWPPTGTWFMGRVFIKVNGENGPGDWAFRITSS